MTKFRDNSLNKFKNQGRERSDSQGSFDQNAELEQRLTELGEENAELRQQNADLAQQNVQQAQQLRELHDKMLWLEEQMRLAMRKKYSPSSERFCSGQGLFDFFETPTTVAAPAVPEIQDPEQQEPKKTSSRKQKGQREAKLDGLPVQTIEYRIPEEECVCEHCNGRLHEMSKEIRRELHVEPAQVHVVEHTSFVYSCRHCEKNELQTPIVVAPMPDPVIPGSFASASAIAYVMSQKFVESMPLYRQEKHLASLGLELSRQTMSNWMIQGAQLLQPVYDFLHGELLKQDVLHADETHMQVIREPGRSAKTKSYLWLYRTSRAEPTIVLFDYQPTRGSEHPVNFLSGFTGYLHVDGYVGYEKLADVKLVGCWAHARRKFFEAVKILPPPEKRTNKAMAPEGLEFCNALFAIERQLETLTPQQRHLARQEHSRPVVDDLRQWLKLMAKTSLPKSPLGKAVNYCLNQWEKLTAFLEDGRLELSNNLAENSIRPVVIGRKNWLFANTPEGAWASATVYSIVETAKANDLIPREYLTYLFEELPARDLAGLDAMETLMPWSEAVQARCRHKVDQ